MKNHCVLPKEMSSTKIFCVHRDSCVATSIVVGCCLSKASCPPSVRPRTSQYTGWNSCVADCRPEVEKTQLNVLIFLFRGINLYSPKYTLCARFRIWPANYKSDHGGSRNPNSQLKSSLLFSTSALGIEREDIQANPYPQLCLRHWLCILSKRKQVSRTVS